MGELGLPFEEVEVRGSLHEVSWTGRKPLFENGPDVPVTVFKDEPSESKGKHNFYTLRVCKECRASWMGAIKEWFQTPKEVPTKVGSGIFIRENGVNREITMEEWERRRAARR